MGTDTSFHGITHKLLYLLVENECGRIVGIIGYVRLAIGEFVLRGTSNLTGPSIKHQEDPHEREKTPAPPTHSTTAGRREKLLPSSVCEVRSDLNLSNTNCSG